MPKKKPSTAKGAVSKDAVPCLRVVVGGKPGKTGQADAKACAIVGESRGSVGKFNLGKKYGSTSKSVDAVDGKTCGITIVQKGKDKGKRKPRPCPKPCAGALKRTGCPVQLAFENGQPFLRFCTVEKQAGYRVDVSSPAEAVKAAEAACATWKATGKFEFPAGTPLRGTRKRKRK